MSGSDRTSAQPPDGWHPLQGQYLKAGGQATALAVVHKDGRKGVYRQLKEPIREVDRARFKRELDVLSRQVRHRSIVSLYEWDGEAQRPWYISELGGSFKDW